MYEINIEHFSVRFIKKLVVADIIINYEVKNT